MISEDRDPLLSEGLRKKLIAFADLSRNPCPSPLNPLE
jgi:hypothetical protein